MQEASDRASIATADNGDVIVDGPGGIAYAMTPEAAIETSDRLFAAATQAQGQRVESRRRQQDRYRA